MRHRRGSKTKQEHSLIRGLKKFLSEKIEPLEYVRAVIPGRISRTEGYSRQLRIRFKHPVRGGAKLLAYSSGAVQELFVETSSPKALRQRVKEFEGLPSEGIRRGERRTGGPSEARLDELSARFTAELGEPEPTAFEPSSFQRSALHLIPKGDVIVAAPTGSGKTWIAEQAIEELLKHGRRCWYTTPLKALSNQKYDNFRKLFGEANVGILTGERDENGSAPVIVATTEVFRNALYTTGRNPWLVVLDEAHYLGDEERGTTWEEIIILAPRETHLLLLSATISNADEIADWMESVRGVRPWLIQEQTRPVPLRYGFRRGSHILPLEPQCFSDREELSHRAQSHLVRLVGSLEEINLLPAIVFLPTRRECDQAAAAFGGYAWKDEDSRQEIFSEVAESNPFIWKNSLAKSLVSAGVASHHAGHLTEWKIAVERILAQGKIRAVFATTTLAAGLDVPARTVVLPGLLTRDAQGARFLNSLEFHQMTGRAGRRGKDKVGFVVVDAIHPDDLYLALSLRDAEPEPIRSAFRVSYFQILNLLTRFGFDAIVKILDSSLVLYQQTSKRGFRKARTHLLAELEMRIQILQQYGYVDASLSLTESGQWASQIRHEQSLVLSELVRRELCQGLSPGELAAWAAAVSSSRSPDLIAGTLNLKPLLGLVNELQRVEKRKGLPVVEFYFAEAVRRGAAVKWWAEGAGWESITADLGIEEGDFQRLVLQSSEILRQLKNLPFPLAGIARESRKMLLRTPLQSCDDGGDVGVKGEGASLDH